MTIESGEKCLALLYQGAASMRSGSFGAAEMMFRMAEREARSMEPGPASDYMPLVHCHMSMLRHKRGQTEEGKSLHESAMKLLDENSARMEQVPFQEFMARVLMRIGEHRRAIPYFERAIQRKSASEDPTAMAALLENAAVCYSMMGLKDHSAIAARAALKVFREYPDDPRLPGVLITLGNALRKSQPAEAEKLYQETADLHLAKSQLESATTAWLNLGVLYGEQGRNAESLDHYQRALHVREQFPTTPISGIAKLLNNIANAHRRMGNVAEAHKQLDRAIELIKLDKESCTALIPSTYGTRGLIFKEDGKDAEAVEWFQRSYLERKNAPSPNFESIIENLEEEIAALKRLGRTQDAIAAEDRLASVYDERNGISHPERDLAPLMSESKGSVLIEVGYGSRPGNRYGRDNIAKLAIELSDAVEAERLGKCTGSFTVPEATTLMFYGEDAEALFRIIGPILLRERMCEGASVSIRQGKEARVIVLPGRVM